MNFLREAASGSCSAMIWTREKGRALQTYCTLFKSSDQTLQFHCPKDFDVAGLQQELQASPGACCFFSMSLPRANIFFEAEFLEAIPGALKFKLPVTLYKVQRRRDIRVPPPDGYLIKVELLESFFPDHCLQRKALDISVGGLSILVEEADLVYFTAGRVIPEIRFPLANRRISCAAEVRHASKLPSGGRYSGGKVGMLFIGMADADQRFIQDYVAEQQRKQFIVFMKKG